MKVIVNENNQYVLRFERGEEIMETLKQFCLREKISGAFLQGLGACNFLKLSAYDLKNKTYPATEFTEDLEIANLVGDISLAEEDLVAHMHGTFVNKKLEALAGHVLAVKVSATCEMLLTKFGSPMKRKLDPEIGIKLLQ